MFIIHWMFDKLGYMPKIDVQVGKVNIEAVWPFPEETPVKKPAVKKATTRTAKKPAVVAKTTRTKKVK